MKIKMDSEIDFLPEMNKTLDGAVKCAYPHKLTGRFVCSSHVVVLSQRSICALRLQV